MTVLLIAEHNNRNLKPATAQVVTAALEMGGPVDVLVLGNDCRSIAEEAAKIAGVRTAYFADNPQFAQESPEAIAEIVVREGKGYDHILFVTGALGKTVMPRVAALMDVSPVSEILAVKGPKTFVRGMYAGSILATVEVDESVVVATVRGTAFAAAGEQAPALVEEVDAPAVETKSRFVSFSETKSDRPELVSARARRQVGRRRGRHPHGGRHGALPERLADRPDGQDRGARSLHRRGPFGRHPAHGRHQGRQGDRRRQQRPRSSDL